MNLIARIPKLLLAAIVLNAALMLWLWYFGLPRYNSDAICFKQPAYMRLFTPWYSLPSLVGQPDTDRFFSYPSCAFTIANYLVFRIFGFSHFVTVGFDLADDLFSQDVGEDAHDLEIALVQRRIGLRAQAAEHADRCAVAVAHRHRHMRADRHRRRDRHRHRHRLEARIRDQLRQAAGEDVPAIDVVEMA